jgi:hypothetical protein
VCYLPKRGGGPGFESRVEHSMELRDRSLREEVETVKDLHGRNFSQLTQNFYIMRAALRYFSEKQGRSITSSRLADNFPLTAPVAGSCLTALEQLEVVKSRSESSSKNRYLPKNVDMERMKQLEKILQESYEIQDF